ncbi:hypothetical protein Hsw_1502 [Hymenobacter swuensis DY53]|uniref:Uncharacterized protein n=1 Tax=Hymenobacter swuensis DY53 TaxID=1227739 RepID=W8EZ98_9BACT|nr:hypothetical protein Hsw_1502 [Hymenobacter swuensis DY53]
MLAMFSASGADKVKILAKFNLYFSGKVPYQLFGYFDRDW